MITSQRNVCRWVDEGLREVSRWLMETENVQEGVEVLEISNTAVLFIRPLTSKSRRASL